MVYEIKTYQEIKEDLQVNVIQNVNIITDINEGSVIDVFLSAIATEFENTYDSMLDIKEDLQITTSTGVNLNELGLLVSAPRNEGSKANCYVSFIRSTPTTAVFSIPQGSVVSTNPAGSKVYSFSTTETVSFETNVNYNLIFYNGLLHYKTDNRTFESMSIYGFSSGSDYEVISYDGELVDNESLSVIDDCNATTGWTIVDGAGAVSLNTSYYQKHNASLNLIKTSTAVKTFGYDKTISAIDLFNKEVFMSYRITSAALAKVNNLKLFIGSTENDYYRFDFDDSDLSQALVTGQWNYLKLNYKQSSLISGLPNIEAITYLKILIETNNTTDTLSANDFLMDFWCSSVSYNYKGDVIKWLKTTQADGVLSSNYSPLSYDILCEATTTGADGNVTIGEIVFKSSSLANIDTIYNYEAGYSGSDIETDFVYRNRIINAGQLRGSSSKESIEATIKELSYIDDCITFDLIEENIENELHTFNSATNKFKLNYEQAINDNTLLIAGYTKDTDFMLNTATNEVLFNIGGTDPANGDVLDVDYTAKRLGKIKIVVKGNAGSLTSGQLEEIESVAYDKVSAGITYSITTPILEETDVSVNITVDDNYNSLEVKNAVNELIISLFNTSKIGEGLKIYDIISAVALMPGVININNVLIDGAATDKSIDKDELLSKGTITITTV